MRKQKNEQSERKRDLRAEITEQIVAALEKGVMPWRRPWNDEGNTIGLPRNAVTKRTYNGGNRLILLGEAIRRGYDDNRWLTFNQAKALGGFVKKGERGVAIEYWSVRPFWKREDVGFRYEGENVAIVTPEEENPRTVTLTDGRIVPTAVITVVTANGAYSWDQAKKHLSIPISRVHTVFNVTQCENLKIEPNTIAVDFDKVQGIVEGMKRDGVSISLAGDAAYYLPAHDRVVMPPPQAFESKEKYLGTLLHELGHATGHAKRLARPFNNGFGSPDYAREELVAELTSMFVAAETGIGFDEPNHASYIDGWLSVLRKDKHELFRASTAASQAADYLIEHSLAITREQEANQEEIEEEMGMEP